MMNEQQVRQIIKDEMQKSLFQYSRVNTHAHTGTDGVKIKESDLILNTRFNGTVEMDNQKTYTFNIPGNRAAPSGLTFYGGAFNSSLSPAVHATVIGSAQFGNNQQFIPQTNSSITVGTVIKTIIQGCGATVTENAANTFLVNSQNHVIYVEYPFNTPVVVADITAYSATSITIQVTTLASNWKINGVWTVS